LCLLWNGLREGLLIRLERCCILLRLRDSLEINSSFASLGDIVIQIKRIIAFFHECEMPSSWLSVDDHRSIRVSNPLKAVSRCILSGNLNI